MGAKIRKMIDHASELLELVVNVIIIGINYIFSKLFIFKKK